MSTVIVLMLLITTEKTQFGADDHGGNDDKHSTAVGSGNSNDKLPLQSVF